MDESLVTNSSAFAASSQPPQPQPVSTPSATASANAGDTGTPAPVAAKPKNQPYQPHSVFGKLFEILGGGPKYEYKVDPNTGEMIKTDVTTKGDLAKSIVAGALTGLFTGAQYHGPGAGLHSFGLGGQAAVDAAMKQDAEKRQRAIDDFKNQQEAQLRKAQIMNINAEAAHNLRNAEKIQGELLDDVIGRDAAQLSQLDESDVIARDIPQDEAIKGMKEGKYNATQSLFLMSGKTEVKDENGNPVRDPKTGEFKMEPLVTIVNNAPVPLTADEAQRYAMDHIPGFSAGVTPASGTKVPLATKRAWDNQVHNVEIARGLAKQIGVTDEEFNKALSTPGAANAFKAFSRFANFEDPYAALEQMEKMKDKDGSPVYSARTIATLRDAFGGKKALDYHNQLEGEKKATVASMEEEGKRNAEFNNPTNLATATGALAKAQQNFQANPTPENKAAVAVAQNRVKTFQTIEAQTRYREAYASQQAQFDAMDVQDQKNLPTLIQGIKNYQVDPEKLAGLRGNARKQFMAEVLRQIPGWSESEYKARFQTAQSFSPAGKQGQNIISLNTFAGHANDANNAIQYLRSTNAKFLNMPINKISGFLAGNPALVNFQTDLMMARDEAMNFIKGGHATLKEEQEALDGLVNANSTPAEAQQFLKTLSGLAVVRANSINSAYEQQMGHSVPNLFNAQAQEALRNLGHGNELDRVIHKVPEGAQPIIRDGKTVGYIQNGKRVDF